jgi:hypothetical protein
MMNDNYPNFAEKFSRIVAAMVRKKTFPGEKYHDRLFAPDESSPAGEPLKQILIKDLDPKTLKYKKPAEPPIKTELKKRRSRSETPKKKNRRELRRELKEINEKIRALENKQK